MSNHNNQHPSWCWALISQAEFAHSFLASSSRRGPFLSVRRRSGGLSCDRDTNKDLDNRSSTRYIFCQTTSPPPGLVQGTVSARFFGPRTTWTRLTPCCYNTPREWMQWALPKAWRLLDRVMNCSAAMPSLLGSST